MEQNHAGRIARAFDRQVDCMLAEPIEIKGNEHFSANRPCHDLSPELGSLFGVP
jgi:hypothetical protein